MYNEKSYKPYSTIGIGVERLAAKQVPMQFAQFYQKHCWQRGKILLFSLK